MCQICLKMSLDLILLCSYITFLCDTLHTSDGVMKSKNSIKPPNCFSLPWKKIRKCWTGFHRKNRFCQSDIFWELLTDDTGVRLLAVISLAASVSPPALRCCPRGGEGKSLPALWLLSPRQFRGTSGRTRLAQRLDAHNGCLMRGSHHQLQLGAVERNWCI